MVLLKDLGLSNPMKIIKLFNIPIAGYVRNHLNGVNMPYIDEITPELQNYLNSSTHEKCLISQKINGTCNNTTLFWQNKLTYSNLCRKYNIKMESTIQRYLECLDMTLETFDEEKFNEFMKMDYQERRNFVRDKRHPDWKERMMDSQKKVMIEKYGVDNPFKSKEIMKQHFENQLNYKNNEELGVSVKNLVEEVGYTSKGVLYLIHKYNIEFIKSKNNTYFLSEENANKIREFVRNSKQGISNFEIELHNFIKSIYDGEILFNDRSITKPYELDVYIPELKLAFEFDGMYWHSEGIIKQSWEEYCKSDKFETFKYRSLNKTKICEENGITLIHIFENEWIHNIDIIKSMIKSCFNKFDNIIDSKECKFRKLDCSESRIFVSNNSIYDFVENINYYGLFYNNELVQLIGGLNDKIEIICNKLNTKIDYNKILKNYCKENDLSNLIYFADRCKYQNIYGLNEIERIDNLSYKYFHKSDVVKYQDIKNELKFNEENEHEICYKNKYFRIYDCGKIKLEFVLKNDE